MLKYRYFIYYEAILRDGTLCHKNIFIELDKEIVNDQILKQVENFLKSQDNNFTNLIIVNFNMVGVFPVETEVQNGEHNQERN